MSHYLISREGPIEACDFSDDDDDDNVSRSSLLDETPSRKHRVLSSMLGTLKKSLSARNVTAKNDSEEDSHYIPPAPILFGKVSGFVSDDEDLTEDESLLSEYDEEKDSKHNNPDMIIRSIMPDRPNGPEIPGSHYHKKQSSHHSHSNRNHERRQRRRGSVSHHSHSTSDEDSSEHQRANRRGSLSHHSHLSSKGQQPEHRRCDRRASLNHHPSSSNENQQAHPRRFNRRASLNHHDACLSSGEQSLPQTRRCHRRASLNASLNHHENPPQNRRCHRRASLNHQTSSVSSGRDEERSVASRRRASLNMICHDDERNEASSSELPRAPSDQNEFPKQRKQKHARPKSSKTTKMAGRNAKQSPTTKTYMLSACPSTPTTMDKLLRNDAINCDGAKAA